MTNNMYKLGNTYIGQHGIYCTSPVKQINPDRWAVITFSVVNYMGERDIMCKDIRMGCCKEKELIAKVEREVKQIVRRAFEEEALQIESIAYYHQYKGQEVQMVLA